MKNKFFFWFLQIFMVICVLDGLAILHLADTDKWVPWAFAIFFECLAWVVVLVKGKNDQTKKGI